MKAISKKFMAFATTILFIATAVVYVDALADSSSGYTDITAEEAWEMLNTTSNGIQIPVDVRTYSEWLGERIDTPYPEFARRYCSFNFYNTDGSYNESAIQEFNSLYGGNEVILYCRSGSRSSAVAHILSEGGFNGTIYNMEGGIIAWKAADLPTKMGDSPPSQPESPSGVTSGDTGVAYTYSTSAIDEDDDAIRYGWDWNGDGTVDEWTENYYQSGREANITHSWDEAGTYYVMVIAEDVVGEQSSFSSPLSVSIGNAPGAPIITGPDSGRARAKYEYTFSSTDADDDELYYYIEWGDGSVEDWIGPYASGEKITIEHKWKTRGTYVIRAKAKDTHNVEGEWGTLEVSMPKTYESAYSPLIKINEWFSSLTGRNLFPVAIETRPGCPDLEL